MEAFLMTRGTVADYAFLGGEPQSHWWDRLSDESLISAEEPEVAICAEPGSLSMFVSGVPSERRDSIGTPIRYSIALNDLQEDAGLAIELTAAMLTPAGRQALGKRLDEQFGAAEVDAILAGSGPAAKIGARTMDVLRTGEPDHEPNHDTAGPDRPGSWAAPAGNPLYQNAFLARVGQLAGGDAAGFAFTSHALASIRGAERAVALLGVDTVILLHDSGVTELHALGKALPYKATSGPPLSGRLLIAALALSGLAILLLIWWLIRRL